jgi:hypothetical protein
MIVIYKMPSPTAIHNAATILRLSVRYQEKQSGDNRNYDNQRGHLLVASAAAAARLFCFLAHNIKYL